MFCNKCGKFIPNGSSFCLYCGNKISPGENTEMKNTMKVPVTPPPKKTFNFKPIILGLVILISLLGSYFFLMRPDKKFSRYLDKNQFDKIKNVYFKDIKPNQKYLIKANDQIEAKINEVVLEFNDEKISYDDAILILDNLKDLGVKVFQIEDAKKEISNLNESKNNFKAAVNFEKEKNYTEALKAYGKVISKDSKNYEKSRKKINELKDAYTKQLFNDIKTHEDKGEYKLALELINEASTLFPDDEEINAKKIDIKEKHDEILAKEREEEGKKAQNEQLITVESTGVIIQDPNYKKAYPDLYEVVVKNNSDKTIKSYEVRMLAWDENGYPLKIKQGFLDDKGSYEFSGIADTNVNIVPGAVSGKDYGWELQEDHKIVKTKAIVKSAEFYDGSSWDNPYYEFFIEKYEGKPLEE